MSLIPFDKFIGFTPEGEAVILNSTFDYEFSGATGEILAPIYHHEFQEKMADTETVLEFWQQEVLHGDYRESLETFCDDLDYEDHVSLLWDYSETYEDEIPNFDEAELWEVSACGRIFTKELLNSLTSPNNNLIDLIKKAEGF